MPTEKDVVRQLISGLKYIHSKQLVHGDLKPSNVHIFPRPDGLPAVVKWAGFALFKSLDQRGGYTLTEVKGSLIWMAPELLELVHKGSNSSGWERLQLADVFSAGLTIFYFLSGGFHPFGKRDQIVDNITNWDAVNAKSKSFLILRNSELVAYYICSLNSELPENHFARRAILEVMLSRKPLIRVNWSYALDKCISHPKQLNKVINYIISLPNKY